MLLETLTLEDFGPYRGQHVFDLTPAPGRHVVLFVGPNGAGKTTLLRALELLFYGPRARTLRPVWRLPLRRTPQRLHSQRPPRRGRRGRSDRARPRRRVEEIVGEFLPRRLASLFFFDDERIEEWSDPDAVGTLLGIDALDTVAYAPLTAEHIRLLGVKARYFW